MPALQDLLLFTAVLVWMIAAKEFKHFRRQKIMINGWAGRDRNSGYTVSRFMVWISNHHICTGGFDEDEFTVECSVDYSHERCGGALLTPTIVQTAGHCISEFPRLVLGKPSPCLRFAVEQGVNRYYVFAGWNVVSYFTKGYGAKQYVLNPKCANTNLRNVSFFKPFPVVHDYGLIILQTGVNPYQGFRSNKANYAPCYSVENLERMWRRAISRELVCLFSGYGRSGPMGEVDHGTPELRHGWGVVRNYLKCIRMIDVPLKTKNFNYLNDATWYCASPLPNHRDRVKGGDSGSPVICDNEYVGLLSQTFLPDDSNQDVTIIAATVFSVFENAAEYRKTLITVMERFPPNTLQIVTRRPPLTREPIIEDFDYRSFARGSSIPRTVLVCVIAVFLNLNKI